MKINLFFVPVICLAAASCSKNTDEFDATGSFEATETIVSAEAQGKLMSLKLEEGDSIPAGKTVGYIDSTQLYLARLQLIQSRKAILSSRPDIRTQIEALEKELDNAITDRDRIANLVKGEVASQKQLDDANARMNILKSRIEAQRSTLSTSTSAIDEQGRTVELQLKQVEDQLRKCRLVNPISGIVLSKYMNEFEMATPGKPVYRIADMSTILLRAYVSGDQLSSVKLGATVDVIVDDIKNGSRKYEGKLEWVSEKAEFTPKTIQTKDERANLVYAIKIRVKNDGALKIGMYGEVKLR
jgi:HlyD family secretion protein